MQAEQAPAGVLKLSSFEEGARHLLAPDQNFEGLMHVERGGDELPRAHRPAVVERDAGRLAALDDDLVDGAPAADSGRRRR